MPTLMPNVLYTGAFSLASLSTKYWLADITCTPLPASACVYATNACTNVLPSPVAISLTLPFIIAKPASSCSSYKTIFPSVCKINAARTKANASVTTFSKDSFPPCTRNFNSCDACNNAVFSPSAFIIV